MLDTCAVEFLQKSTRYNNDIIIKELRNEEREQKEGLHKACCASSNKKEC